MSFQNLWRAARKCQTSKTSVQSLRRTASETAEQQQDSCPNHAKQRPRTMPKRCLRNALGAEWAARTFGGPLWNVKHQKTSVQSLWPTASETAEQQQDSCPNHAKQRPRTMPKRCLRNALSVEWASKTFGGPLWNVKHQKLASKAFGGPLPKQPNSSRIRVQTMRYSDHEQCRNVAYETQ